MNAASTRSPRGSAWSSAALAAGNQRGFSLVELIAVLILLGVLAAVALPRLDVVDRLRSDNWREQTVAGLRLAHATAVAHRRLVCASFDASGVLLLRVAAVNPANDCAAPLNGPDGSARFGSQAPDSAPLTTPAGPLYFQPGGQVSADGAGLQIGGRSIAVNGVDAIQVHGQSGHVQ
jgi:MSHA pilin protein MshC